MLLLLLKEHLRVLADELGATSRCGWTRRRVPGPSHVGLLSRGYRVRALSRSRGLLVSQAVRGQEPLCRRRLRLRRHDRRGYAPVGLQWARLPIERLPGVGSLKQSRCGRGRFRCRGGGVVGTRIQLLNGGESRLE